MRKGAIIPVSAERLAHLVTAGSALALSVQFGWTMLAPLDGDNRLWAADALALALSEAGLAHSAFVLAMVGAIKSRGTRLATTGLVTLGYAALLARLGLLFDSKTLFTGLCIIMLAKMIAAILHPEKVARSALSSFGLLIFQAALVISFIMVERFPAFGFTPEALATLQDGSESFGLSLPWLPRLVALCAVYYFLVALLGFARVIAARSMGADVWLRDAGIELRFSRREMELRETQSLEQGGHLLSLMCFGAAASALSSPNWVTVPIGLLAAIAGLWFLAYWIDALFTVTVVRARHGELEWLVCAPFSGCKHRLADAITAAKLHADRTSLRLDAKPDALNCAFGLDQWAEREVVRSLLSAYVELGSGDAAWRSVGVQPDVRAFLGADAERMLRTPTRANLGPLGATATPSAVRVTAD